MVRKFGVRAAVLCLAVTATPAVPAGASAQDRPWYDDPAVEQRVEAIVSRMTLEDKVDLVTGEIISGFGFSNNAMPHLGIPQLGAFDGPVGVRTGAGPGGAGSRRPSTLLPSGTSLASTFDEERAFQFGRVMGVETHLSSGNMMLAPTTDVLRNPFHPRAWETFSEDPLLTGRIGTADVGGIQSVRGVGAAVKHYQGNTQEHRRNTVNAVIDERTLQEVYNAPFEMVVREEHPASVMCAFTSINGVDSCSSRELLTEMLKGQMGFRGFVQTDYQANLETVESANAGTDLDMPGVNTGENPLEESGFTVWAGRLLQAVRNGQVSEERLTEMSRRILRAMIGVGMFDNPPTEAPLPLEEHGRTARDLSAEGTVLLKNERRILPLTNRRFDSIAVIGTATDVAWRGGGSALVTPPYESSPLDAITERAGAGVEILTAEGVEPVGPASLVTATPPVPRSFLAPPGGQPGEGLRGEYFTSNDLSGEPVATVVDPIAARAGGFYGFFPPPVPGQPEVPGAQSIRWTGTLTAPATGNYRFEVVAFGTARAFLDGELVADVPTAQRVGHPERRFIDVRLRAGEPHELRIEYLANSPEHQTQFGFLYGSQVSFGWVHGRNEVAPRIREAAEVARRADVAIVFARTFESEGFIDRATLELPNDQTQLIREVARRNPNTVVVLQTGGAVATGSWVAAPEGIVQNWFGGQEQGNAIADVLWGDVNPSGSLPITFPRSDRQTPITFRNDPVQYPEVNDMTVYKEGVFVGYRGHQQFNLPTDFPFGHGLSYTSFRYSDLRTPRTPVTPGNGDVEVSFTLTNTGPRRGTEIAQVYVGKLPTQAVETPKRNLAGWARATLDPGESKRVTATLDRQALRYWDVDSDRWVTPSGPVRVMVARSAADPVLTGTVRVGS